MKYSSTRDPKHKRTPSEAILEGLSAEGGLFMPEAMSLMSFPMADLPSMSVRDISVAVLSRFFDDFTESELRTAVSGAYDRAFPGGDIAPLQRVGEAYVLELYHGPTCAFKDVALSLLPRLLTTARDKCGVTDEICILTATSGDTGSAALSGFADVPGTRIVVFYPEGGVSPAQERQMTTREGDNIHVCAVRGNFDDAQSGVKAIFSDPPEIPGLRFSSANSINIGRLAPQIAYYFKAYRDLMAEGRIVMGDAVNFVVPTGNFGNILAGYFAKKMGLPVGRLICASNRNRVLTDFFETGCYDRRRPFHLTSSPSMDILISSNLERLLFLLCGAEKTAQWMRALREEGRYTLPEEAHAALRNEFSAASADDAETAETIRRVYENNAYLIDPHTAVGFCALEKWRATEEANGAPVVVLSTASPYKFSRSVLTALGQETTGNEFTDMQRLCEKTGIAIPEPLRGLSERPVLHRDSCRVSEMRSYVEQCAGGGK